MALSSIVKPEAKAPRIIIYGPSGIGKSTFAAQAENPIFIQTEDGAGAIDVPVFPLAANWSDVMGNLKDLATESHKYKTLVVDSIDWMEPMIWAQVCAENNVDSIEKVGGGYGKGYTMALDLWRQYLNALNWLRDNKGMTIIQIGHADIKRFEDPRADAYDRYVIKLNQKAAGLMIEHSDILIFADYHLATTETDMGFGQKRTRAVGGGARMLNFTERPAFLAKNRFGLPDKIPFDAKGDYWNTIKKSIPYFNKPSTTTKEK